MKKIFSLLSISLMFVACGGSADDSNDDSSESTDTLAVVADTDYETITFEAEDGLTVTGNLYEVENATKYIVLCHQARFNKFEYEGIGQRLNDLGYTCLAIDQRSGGPIANQVNETNLAAKEKEMGVDYLDAPADITAAVNYMSEKYSSTVILWGSSYSSTLVLYEAVANENVEAVVSFSPGDYFADTLGSLVPMIAAYEKPMFLTSGGWEAPDVATLIEGKEMGTNQIQFIPEGDGHHGSRALWEEQDGGEEYWTAISAWLESL